MIVQIINVILPNHTPNIKYSNTFGKEMVVSLIFFIKNIYLTILYSSPPPYYHQSLHLDYHRTLLSNLPATQPIKGIEETAGAAASTNTSPNKSPSSFCTSDCFDACFTFSYCSYVLRLLLSQTRRLVNP